MLQINWYQPDAATMDRHELKATRLWNGDREDVDGEVGGDAVVGASARNKRRVVMSTAGQPLEAAKKRAKQSQKKSAAAPAGGAGVGAAALLGKLASWAGLSSPVRCVACAVGARLPGKLVVATAAQPLDAAERMS